MKYHVRHKDGTTLDWTDSRTDALRFANDCNAQVFEVTPAGIATLIRAVRR